LQPGKLSEFTKFLRFLKNQADLRNIGAFQKIRRIYKILALYRNQADLRNIGTLQKNRRTIESWRALKSPRLVKKSAGLENTGGPLTV
jgi:hypothetical protein